MGFLKQSFLLGLLCCFVEAQFSGSTLSPQAKATADYRQITYPGCLGALQQWKSKHLKWDEITFENELAFRKAQNCLVTKSVAAESRTEATVRAHAATAVPVEPSAVSPGNGYFACRQGPSGPICNWSNGQQGLPTLPALGPQNGGQWVYTPQNAGWGYIPGQNEPSYSFTYNGGGTQNPPTFYPWSGQPGSTGWQWFPDFNGAQSGQWRYTSGSQTTFVYQIINGNGKGQPPPNFSTYFQNSQGHVSQFNEIYGGSGVQNGGAYPGPSAQGAQACEDGERTCYLLAESGQCRGENEDYMRETCAKSCKYCSVIGKDPNVLPKFQGCFDWHKFCGEWAKDGQCEDFPIMKTICKKSCKACGSGLGSAPAPTPKKSVSECPSVLFVPFNQGTSNRVNAGYDDRGNSLSVCRFSVKGYLSPGRYDGNYCYVSFRAVEYKEKDNFEILTNPNNANIQWKRRPNDFVMPGNAVIGGSYEHAHDLLLGRCYANKNGKSVLLPGRLHPQYSKALHVPWDRSEFQCLDYELLVCD